MKDQDTTVQQLKEKVTQFRDARNWRKYNKPKDMAISIALESAELLELFQWKSEELIQDLEKNSEFIDEVRFEMADIINYLFDFADTLNIDIVKAVEDKLMKAGEKFPVTTMLEWQKMSEADHLKAYQELKQKYRAHLIKDSK